MRQTDICDSPDHTDWKQEGGAERCEMVEGIGIDSAHRRMRKSFRSSERGSS